MLPPLFSNSSITIIVDCELKRLDDMHRLPRLSVAPHDVLKPHAAGVEHIAGTVFRHFQNHDPLLRSQ